MPDPDLERLRESIRQNLEALDQILHRQAEQEPERPPLRLIKGGAVAAALVAGVEWLRRHREVPVALVVAGVAGAVAWLMWPDPGMQPSVEPPGRTSTVTVRVAPPPKTSVPPLTTPRTAAPTFTVTVGPTIGPIARSPAPTTVPSDQATVPPPVRTTAPTPTAQPTTAPTSPRRTTAPPTEPTRTTTPPRTTPSCLILVRVSAVVGVCVRL